MGSMKVEKFTEVDAFGLVDVPGSAVTVGPVRAAKKVLERTTADLARHVTYALAVRGIDGSGGAVALNGDPAADGRDELIERFVEEAQAWSGSTNFRASHGMGIDRDPIAPLLAAPTAGFDEAMAASAESCLVDSDGPVLIASEKDEAALRARLDARSIESRPAELDEALAADGATVFVRCGTGALNHGVLDGVSAARVIALTANATTARGLAFATRAGCVIVPDFVSAGGWAHACAADASLDDIAASARAVAETAIGAGVNAFVHAAGAAEANLRSRTDDLPFGRPLAP